MTKEIWRDIVGYEGVYQVSNLGKVKRLKGYKCRNDRIIRAKITKDGYYETTLTMAGKPKTIRTHRLVAFAFCENPYNKPEVNHKDGNKLNNSADNLEWVTSSENQKHAYKLGLQKVSGGALSNRKKIRCIELNITTDSMNDMQRLLCKMGYTSAKRINRLSSAMNSGRKQYLGFHFEFV